MPIHRLIRPDSGNAAADRIGLGLKRRVQTEFPGLSRTLRIHHDRILAAFNGFLDGASLLYLATDRISQNQRYRKTVRRGVQLKLSEGGKRKRVRGEDAAIR